MAKYTTQLRTYVENGGNVFDFDYPIFDENYRSVLETKIIDYYYFREIGLETIGQFKWFLKSKLNRIMPYYNELYGTIGLITSKDYAINQNSVETHTRTVTSSNTGKVDSNANSTSEVNSQDVFSDTPQAKLQSLDYATTLSEGEASTNDTTQGSSFSTGSADLHESFVIEMTGGGGLRYNADVLMEWRKSFINIDQMVIDELQNLFLNIF